MFGLLFGLFSSPPTVNSTILHHSKELNKCIIIGVLGIVALTIGIAGGGFATGAAAWASIALGIGTGALLPAVIIGPGEYYSKHQYIKLAQAGYGWDRIYDLRKKFGASEDESLIKAWKRYKNNHPDADASQPQD